MTTIIRILILTIAATAVALAQPQRPTVPNRSDVTVTRLDVSSGDNDFSPAVIRGGEFLVFTSARSGASGSRGDERIWITVGNGSAWGRPEPLDLTMTDAHHIGGATFTPDGNTMIFAAYEVDASGLEGRGRTDLYSAERVGGRWTNVRNLSAINSSAWDSHPTLSADGRTLYFASDRSGGRGGADIWMTRLEGDAWGAPRNLGEPINTDSNDLTPSIAPDGATLFFSSNGHGGAGGYDIFAATSPSADGTRWGSLENVGTPVNSPADEHGWVSQPNRKEAYFASNRGGDFDLYMANPSPKPAGPLVTVSGRVTDARTGNPVAATIAVTDLSTREQVALYRTDDRNGDYYVILKPGVRYSITAEAPGYIFYSDEYRVPSGNARDLRNDIKLQPIEGGSTRLLVFFDYDKAELQQESFPDLQRATEFIRNNRRVLVEVAGHTDSIGSAQYNRKLSQDRAESVKRYFVQQGIEASRIKAKGYGEEQPVADNGSEEGRARNRRVEMRVLRE